MVEPTRGWDWDMGVDAKRSEGNDRIKGWIEEEKTQGTGHAIRCWFRYIMRNNSHFTKGQFKLPLLLCNHLHFSTQSVRLSEGKLLHCSSETLLIDNCEELLAIPLAA